MSILKDSSRLLISQSWRQIVTSVKTPVPRHNSLHGTTPLALAICRSPRGRVGCFWKRVRVHDWSSLHSDPSTFLVGRRRNKFLRSKLGPAFGTRGGTLFHPDLHLWESGLECAIHTVQGHGSCLSHSVYCRGFALMILRKRSDYIVSPFISKTDSFGYKRKESAWTILCQADSGISIDQYQSSSSSEETSTVSSHW